MKKENNFFSFKILFFFLLFLFIFSVNSATVYEINQSIDGTSDYKKVEFSGSQKTLNHYFKYTFTTTPSSKISAFRIQFDEFNDLSIERNRVFCTFVDASTNDNDLINAVGLMDNTTSSCIGTFTNGFYDGIIEHDNSKKKLAIYLVTLGNIDFTARLYLRINEYILPVAENTIFQDESYSLIPVTIIISHFREKASKVLFYSYTRELQMYYTEENTPYPERLFFGNIMSVYTNPNMVRQKYKNADTMVLLTKQFGAEDMIGEPFQFQVKFFSSNYLLDYYMGSNLEGRSKNTPLAINMTECENPYYVILNYNVPEKQTSLYFDEIYGKIKSLSVAPFLTSPTWEKMIQNDMQVIDADSRKFVLPANSLSHIDVYKVECEVPLLLNFYYIDESASIPELDYGHVAITTLKSYKSVSLPFASGVTTPQLTIEVFNPIKDPFVIVDDGQNEKIISKNSVIRSMPFTTSNPIVLKERNGDSNSRIIIKVGYNTGSWTQVSENVVYSLNLNMYVFSFPADADKYNYTYALLKTSGTNSEDNVKYCYGTNIGSAILPSSENCYRVSHDNSYTIKVLNPLVMYKDYDMDEELTYYVSLRPTERSDSLEINADLVKYDTTERNFEGIGNNLVLTNGKENTVLTSPENKDENILIQIQSCDNSKLTFGVYDGYDNKQIVSDIEIPAGKKHYYTKYKNTFLETEVKLSGNIGTKVYLKHTGISNSYNPSIKDSYSLSFNQDLNQLIVENPLKTSERMNYTVYVSRQGDLSNQDLTLCSFAEIKSTIALYNQTFVSFANKTTFNINFNKLGLSKGDKFEAIAFIEQEPNSKLSFITDVFTGTVGEIETKSITEIKTEDTVDPDYVYVTKTAQSDEMTYYFSFLPTKVFNVSVGALRIEVESDDSGPFNRIACAFVNEEDDANSMVEAVEEIASQYNSYCVGGRSRTNGRIYNFLFKYSYTKDSKPRRLVIKLNNNGYDGNFNIYVRKGDNVYLEHTDFIEQKEYGKQEEFKKSIIPYIIDLETIRGDSQTDYISKILIYSQHLEMQMYYLDPSEERNDPILLFTGNIMLVYTKLTLAEQKYHATKLILLSENLNGQEHSAVGITFRFHTKMFRSEDQIEYFVSNNAGRTLNFPLSIEMNTCTSTNNKYYYILNYNQPEEERILYLDSVFGIIKNARIANEINAERWDSLLTNSMTEITNYTFTLSEKSQHIDVIEIECTTPLLTNIYYNYQGQVFSGLGRGDIVVKNLGPQETFSFTLLSASVNFYYSISVFNSKENPDLTFSFDNVQYHHITENSLQVGMILNKMPYKVSVDNNKNTDTRIIFKIGYGVESEWIDEGENIEGKLYSSGSRFVYKFPMGENRRNFTNVVLDIKPMKKDSQELAENVKFCYSTSIGMAIDPSQENCYRTGANIPYSLTFINPLIAPKNYKSLSDNYYVTISPFTSNEYISLGITENKYTVEDRNLEGVNKILKLESTTQKSTILSIPEIITNTQIVVQLQACVASLNQINYVNKNAYSGDVISTGTIPVNRNDYHYTINNILMETEVEFTGAINDLIFVKHTGITDYSIITQSYYSTFDINENTVSIIKPISDEKFRITVLVGKPDRFAGYNLCTFAEKKESEYKDLANYAKTFISESSNTITHFIDFRSFSFKQGDEFDLLVYAVQEDNSKLEFLFPVISGIVGEIKGITEISGLIDSNYVTQDFTQNRTTNYLFYDFPRNPIGDVASLKIINSEEGMRVNKVGCVFVKRNTEDADMVSAVNKAMMEGNSVCYGQTEKDTNGFDALINAKDVRNGYGRIVIQILYGFGENDKKVKKAKNGKLSEDGYKMTINIRTNGFEVDTQNSQYNEKEDLTVMPYVLDLKKIRDSQEGENYISKVMVYSSTREMQMFYIGDNGAPTELFSGNIMLVYTNPDVINEKYHGANIMILLTDSLSNSGKETVGEEFRFKTYFFKSDNTMQYYVSPNPDGRLLNKPTMIEMNSCDVPYYYILNYNFPEEDNRVLHIDNIFGEINTMKIANQLNKNDWYDLIREMEEFSGNEYLIEGQTDYHMDVIEVTCKVPSLLNIYYTDENDPNYSNLGQSDIAILNLSPNKSQRVTFKSNLDRDFIYTFNILLETGNPDILITFEDEEEGMRIKENGIYTKNSNINYEYITVSNKKLSGNTKTRIIFKFGYSIDNTFTKINNNIYQLQKPDKTANLFAYKFNTGEDRLNTTSIDFRVSTSLENVKFCYTTNLGSYVEPSSQNCYRVGRTNSYTISLLNPYLMYKNYKAGDEKNVMVYYVSFRTEDVTQNITIFPSLNNYTTTNRNLENYANTITITKNGSTILTSPKDNMLFVQMQSCTKNAYLSYEFKNAYNSSSLNIRDQISANTKNYFVNVPNIKLDTELALETKNSAEIFIKHIGVNQKYQPIIKSIVVGYDGSKKLNFTQPIDNEEFKYTIYLDKKGNLEKQGYTLCSFTKNSKFAYYSTSITSKDKVVEITLDFESKTLKGYEKFDLLIFAEQTNKGKLMILSDLFQSAKKKKSSSSNLVLVIVIVILTVLLVGGGITAFILLRRYKLKPVGEKLDAKETSLTMVDNKKEKMITSTASQNNE
jgi:hypothetical protein